jgi:hypothetical protein
MDLGTLVFIEEFICKYSIANLYAMERGGVMCHLHVLMVLNHACVCLIHTWGKFLVDVASSMNGGYSRAYVACLIDSLCSTVGY